MDGSGMLKNIVPTVRTYKLERLWKISVFGSGKEICIGGTRMQHYYVKNVRNKKSCYISSELLTFKCIKFINNHLSIHVLFSLTV